MIEVFKTTIQNANEAKEITQKLLDYYPLIKINFDLEDCDKILRIEGSEVDYNCIVVLLESTGFKFELLV